MSELRTRSRADLFGRVLTPADREEIRERLAHREEREVGESMSALLFRLGAERLALPAEAASAVTPTLHIARIPHRSGTVLLGLVAARGELLPCCSLARLLDLNDAGYASERMLLLEEAPGRRWALPVTAVEGVRVCAVDRTGMRTEMFEAQCVDSDARFALLDPVALFRQLRLATA